MQTDLQDNLGFKDGIKTFAYKASMFKPTEDEFDKKKKKKKTKKKKKVEGEEKKEGDEAKPEEK